MNYLKHSLEGLNNRFKMAKESVNLNIIELSYLKKRGREDQRNKISKKISRTSEACGSTPGILTCVIIACQREKEKGTEKKCKNNDPKLFNLVKNINLHIKEA